MLRITLYSMALIGLKLIVNHTIYFLLPGIQDVRGSP